MALQWRSFTFFDKEVVQTDEWFKTCTLTASCNGLFWGQESGEVTETDGQLARQKSWRAHSKRVSHLFFSKTLGMLLSVGDDEDGDPVMHLWNIDKMDKATEAPVLVKSVKVQHGTKVFPVTAIAVLENLSQVAIGLENGVVLLSKGDWIKDKTVKLKAVYEGSSSITGLGFCQKETAKPESLFIVSLTGVASISTASYKETLVDIDTKGCELGNVIMAPPGYAPDLVLARKEAVTFYGPNGRGLNFGIVGDKTMVSWFHSYLVVVTTVSTIHSERSAEATSPQSPTTAPYSQLIGGSSSLGTVLTIYDLKSKYVAYRSSFGREVFDALRGVDVGEGILHIIPGKADLLIVTRFKNVYRLTERDLESRLEAFYNQHLYNVAINMVVMSKINSFQADEAAEFEKLDKSSTSYQTIMEIHKRHADYLYSKADFFGAVTHYIRTISHLSPSYVILKFVDPSHIAQLTQYLQALHDSSSATQNHTNLLLNCYSKLKKEDRIADLISKGGFEVESGIRICRTAGYFSQALLLAKSAQLHDWVISILFEDIHDPNQVLSYIAELDHESIGGAMKRYGGSLIRQLPKESTEVLIRLCSESYTFYPEDFIPFYVDLRTWCIEFLERVFSAQTIVRDDATVSSYTGDRDEQSRSAVTNTLFELYLQNYASQKSVSFVLNGSQLGSYLTEWARHIHLGEPNVSICLGIRLINLDQALVLCKRHSFSDGILCIFEKMGRFMDLLQYHHEKQDYGQMMDLCRIYGEQYPELWKETLVLLTKADVVNEDMLKDTIQEIDRLNLLAPLQIIQILSTNEKITLGLVKEFITRKIRKEKAAIEESWKATAKYQEEIAEMTKEIDDLQNKPVVFQNSKCEFCRQLLDRPSVHFLCKHSYHERCLGESSARRECPRCSPERRILQELIKTQQRGVHQHEDFIKELNDKDDQFDFIANYFSKNVFGGVGR